MNCKQYWIAPPPPPPPSCIEAAVAKKGKNHNNGEIIWNSCKKDEKTQPTFQLVNVDISLFSHVSILLLSHTDTWHKNTFRFFSFRLCQISVSFIYKQQCQTYLHVWYKLCVENKQTLKYIKPSRNTNCRTLGILKVVCIL